MNKKIYVSRFLLAELLKVDTRTLYRWKGLEEYRNNKGEYELKGAFDWWNKNINKGGGSEETRSSRQEYWQYRAEGEELKLKKLQESYVSKGAVIQGFNSRARDLCAQLKLLALDLTQEIYNKAGDEIRETLREGADNWLRKVCSKGNFATYSKEEAQGIIEGYRELIAQG